MRCVEAAFDALQPVAFLDVARGKALYRRHLRPFEVGEFRLQLGRSHIGPHNFAALDTGISARVELCLDARERLLANLRHAWDIDADAADIEFEAVIDAAQAALFIAAEEERSRAVGTALMQQADPAACVAKKDEIFAQQADADGR
jgi:hypothetical protein